MKNDNLILISTVCEFYRLDYGFFDILDHHGLLELHYIGDLPHLPEEGLAKLEKIIRLQNDLQVNLEGVAVIMDLIDRIENLENENRNLRSQIKLFD